MLKTLRNRKTAKKIWIALAAIIIPAFCFWGFGSAMRGRKKTVSLGIISGKTINIQEYRKNYKAIWDQYLIRIGEEQLAKLGKYLDLETQTWDRIILLTEAKRRRIKINNKEVINFIKQYPFFQRDGVFNPGSYREMVNYFFRTKPRMFEEETRDNLIIAKLYASVTREITISDEEIKREYIKENEQISLEYITAIAGDFLNDVSLQDNELSDYYNQNPEQFKQPLAYNLEYINIDTKEKETINKIMQSFNQGFSLQDIVKDMNLELKETGPFSNNDPIPKIGWSTEILQAIEKLKPQGKAWPEPIQGDTEAVYFIRLKDKKAPYVLSFKEVKDKVSQLARLEKAKQIAKEKLTACRNEVQTSNIASAAKKFNLKTGKTELFKRKGYVEGLGDSDIFFGAIENLQQNALSPVIDSASGFYIVKLAERVEPDEEKFRQEKQDYGNSLLVEKKQYYFLKFLAKLKTSPNTYRFTATP